jgi:DNA-binding IclR family transcriptional regulator
MHGESAIYLEVVEGTHTVRYTARAGGTRPAHSSAIGKAVLSFLSDKDLDAAIAKLPLTAITERTILDAAALAEDIRAGRARGCFFSRGETVTDVMGVAIARRIAGEPFGIGLAGPISRVESRLKSYLVALNDAGRAVEAIDASLTGAS